MLLNVAFLGFGNVGRALGELLLEKQGILRTEYGLQVRVVGISTGHHGQVIDSTGIDLRTALDASRFGSLNGLNQGPPIKDTWQFLTECPAQLYFESIPTNPNDGQPALAYTYSLLERGIHVVSANKGPVAFGYGNLRALAAKHNAGYFFESTVMDGAPVLGVGREGLPTLDIKRISGVFNSTTNFIITLMEQDGISFETALKRAQEIGIAETDPTLDIDGWDASIKTIILANVLMGADLRPADVNRTGIGDLTSGDVQSALEEGQRIRLICEAERQPDGLVKATVQPRWIPTSDILSSITGTTSIVSFETDVLPQLTLIEHDPGPNTTAYGMLADMINIVRGRHIDGRRLNGVR